MPTMQQRETAKGRAAYEQHLKNLFAEEERKARKLKSRVRHLRSVLVEVADTLSAPAEYAREQLDKDTARARRKTK